MKLEYTYNDNEINKRIFIRIGLVIGIPIFIFFLLQDMTLGTCIILEGTIFLFYLLAKKYNDNLQKHNQLLINEGNKLQGYVIRAYRKYTSSGINADTRYNCKLRVLVNNKEYNVLHLKNNEAFDKLIKLLKYHDRIPVDVYERDGKMCTDLNSINLN